MDALTAQLASTHIDSGRYIRPTLRANKRRRLCSFGSIEDSERLSFILNKPVYNFVDRIPRDAPIYEFKTYFTRMMRNEKILLVSKQQVYDRSLTSFIKCQKVEYLKNFFYLWSRGFDSYNNDYDYWHYQCFNRLVLLRRELFLLRRLYVRIREDIFKKSDFHKRRVMIRNVLTEWKSLTIDNRAPPMSLPSDDKSLYDISVDLKVKSPDGSIKLVNKTPYVELYDKYFVKGINPSINIRIKAFSQMGFPISYLENMLEMNDKQISKKPNIEEMILKVFGKYSTTKNKKKK